MFPGFPSGAGGWRCRLLYKEKSYRVWQGWPREGKSLEKAQGEGGGVAGTRGKGTSTSGNREISKDKLEEVLLCDDET